MKPQKSFKAFSKDLKCRDFQYEVGKSYENKKPIELCGNGFHACKLPLDVLGFYSDVANNRYAEVTQSGELKSSDDKTVSSKIKIEAEISFRDLLSSHFKLIIDICKKSSKKNTSGNRSHANTSGYGSHANTSGYGSHANTSGNDSHANTSGNRSHANTSGNRSHAKVEGKNSIACGFGINNAVSGKIGNWIVISEYDNNYSLLYVKTAKIDGKKLKEDTYYILKNNRIVKAK